MGTIKRLADVTPAVLAGGKVFAENVTVPASVYVVLVTIQLDADSVLKHVHSGTDGDASELLAGAALVAGKEYSIPLAVDPGEPFNLILASAATIKRLLIQGSAS